MFADSREIAALDRDGLTCCQQREERAVPDLPDSRAPLRTRSRVERFDDASTETSS
jgi:hypothetical protein